MTLRQNHLSDHRLIELCFECNAGEAEQQHLACCAVCEERRTRVSLLLHEVSEVAAAQGDVAFSTERLASQRARILQRIQHEARHARVISFPAARGHSSSQRTRPGTRWIAGAAAAGLLIGILAGHFSHQLPGGIASPSSPAMVTEPAAAAPQFVAVSLSEDEFIGQIEMEVEGMGGSALGPLDDLTPSIWEVAAP